VHRIRTADPVTNADGTTESRHSEKRLHARRRAVSPSSSTSRATRHSSREERRAR